MVRHHLINGRHGLFFGHGHHYALAGRKTVRLYHDGSTLFFHKSFGRIDVRAHFKRRGGNMVLLHQVFGKGFGSFQFRRILIGPENRQAPGTKYIADTCHQCSFRPHHRQIDAVLFCIIRNLVQIIQVQCNTFTFGEFCNPGVTRYHADTLYLAALGHFPCQGMFPAAAANQ